MHNSAVFLVDGAGREAGRSLSLDLALQGCRIAANDISPDALAETVRQITGRGGAARAYDEDSAKGLPARALVERVLADWGRLDALVLTSEAHPRAGLLDLDDWDWQRALDVNLSGRFLLIQAAAREMAARGGGIILNCVPAAPAPGLAGAVGLQAARLLGERAAPELARQKIRLVNLLYPPGPDYGSIIAQVRELCQDQAFAPSHS